MTISKAFLSGKLINDGAPSAIEFLDDGVHVADSAISIDFVGDSVQATTDGAGNVSVNISNNAVDLSLVAPLDSPALTGIPTAPTAVAGTNTTQLASTAFVATAVNSVALPSQTGNSGKFLSTNGSTASWSTVAAGNAGTVTSVSATVPAFMSVSGSPITASGTLAFSLSGSALPASSGGTGQTSYAVGDLLYAGTTTTLAKLPDVATGNALISGGVGAAPSWGKVGLNTHVSGTLQVGNGGTGVTTLTGLVKANGSSAFTAAVAGVDYMSPSAELDGGTF